MPTSSAHRTLDLPQAMPGFEHVRRYRDTVRDIVIAKLLPGDFYVTREDEVLDTVLGSCVAACIHNPRLKIGGMNHFMLPRPTGAGVDTWDDLRGRATRYGSASMEQLINRILSNGVRREELEVKVFGGARVLAAMTDVGMHNVIFVREFLKKEGLKVVAEDVGDVCPRHIRFFPLTGKVHVRQLGASQQSGVASREAKYLKGLATQPVSGGIDLFD
ncbi:MAG: chemoreceptor glutamine deamidase CheD [Candidatus Obscuribacterales bacterium]|nr:chemoreceptor glutamine deamidase CheD [Steroidobacteraceae bacterium]